MSATQPLWKKLVFLLITLMQKLNTHCIQYYRCSMWVPCIFIGWYKSVFELQLFVFIVPINLVIWQKGFNLCISVIVFSPLILFEYTNEHLYTIAYLFNYWWFNESLIFILVATVYRGDRSTVWDKYLPEATRPDRTPAGSEVNPKFQLPRNRASKKWWKSENFNKR